VDALPEVVWQVLTDFGSYQEWNPSLVAISGEDVPGRTPRAVAHRLAEQQHAF
jgi:hypothetical protein